jgi:ABC-type transporter Mla subunit MlaD
MKTKEEIAQWIIDNRYPKSENDKVSDFEMYHHIVDNIDQNTKQLVDEIAELRKTGLESIKIAEDLSDLKKKYESRVEELQAKLKASKSEANEIVDYKEQYDNLLDILELRSNEYSIKAILANYTITFCS